MAKQQRMMRIEQRSALAAIQQLESRSDEELARETKYRAAAQAILGARAAERYDAKTAREHFKRAVAAAAPQERMQLRRMAEASLALAERRADDLKTAVEKLGQEAPSSRQLFLLKAMGLVAPPPGSSMLLRARGVALIILLIVTLLAIGFGIVELVSLPFGGVDIAWAVVIGVIVVIAALAVLAIFGKRKQQRMQTQRTAAATKK